MMTSPALPPPVGFFFVDFLCRRLVVFICIIPRLTTNGSCDRGHEFREAVTRSPGDLARPEALCRLDRSLRQGPLDVFSGIVLTEIWIKIKDGQGSLALRERVVDSPDNLQVAEAEAPYQKGLYASQVAAEFIEGGGERRVRAHELRLQQLDTHQIEKIVVLDIQIRSGAIDLLDDAARIWRQGNVEPADAAMEPVNVNLAGLGGYRWITGVPSFGEPPI